MPAVVHWLHNSIGSAEIYDALGGFTINNYFGLGWNFDTSGQFEFGAGSFSMLRDAFGLVFHNCEKFLVQ